jgi:hypothetical protein
VPVIRAKTQEEFVPQMVNFDKLGGVSFHKGCTCTGYDPRVKSSPDRPFTRPDPAWMQGRHAGRFPTRLPAPTATGLPWPLYLSPLPRQGFMRGRLTVPLFPTLTW